MLPILFYDHTTLQLFSSPWAVWRQVGLCQEEEREREASLASGVWGQWCAGMLQSHQFTYHGWREIQGFNFDWINEGRVQSITVSSSPGSTEGSFVFGPSAFSFLFICANWYRLLQSFLSYHLFSKIRACNWAKPLQHWQSLGGCRDSCRESLEYWGELVEESREPLAWELSSACESWEVCSPPFAVMLSFRERGDQHHFVHVSLAQHSGGCCQLCLFIQVAGTGIWKGL